MTILQLGRYGDIINILPVARAMAHRQEVSFCVSQQFESVLDGVSYVKPLVLDVHYSHTKEAKNRLTASGIDQLSILNTQLYRTDEPGPGAETHSFSRDSWRLAGYLHEYGKLPLVFDRRDHNRELELVLQAGVGPGTTLFSLVGHSSPMPDRAGVAAEIGTCGDVFNTATIQAERIYDLLGLFDVARGAILSDSAPLHLANASAIPVGAFISDRPTQWFGTSPQRECMEVRYSAAAGAVPRMVNYIEQRNRGAILHVYPWHQMTIGSHGRHRTARLTWNALYRNSNSVRPMPYLDKYTSNSAKSLGDADIPTFNDVFNWAVEQCAPDGMVLYTNSDVCLRPDLEREMIGWVKKYGCYYTHRIDVPNATSQPDWKKPVYAGVDVFAFTPAWWESVRSDAPTLYIGREGWDAVVKVLMQRSGFMPSKPMAWHQIHRNGYSGVMPPPSQRYNRATVSDWLRAKGKSHLLIAAHNAYGKPLVAPF